MLKNLTLFSLLLLGYVVSNAQISTNYSEGFDDIASLTDWTFVNNADVLGLTSEFQGSDFVFDAFEGAPDSYLGFNFNNTAGSQISSWAISPEFELLPGATFTYYTRTSSTMFPDRSELRLSTSGSSVDVGTMPSDVGDFTIQAIDINTSLVVGGYPETWTQFTYTYNGPSATGRVAMRYVVLADAGPSGANSNYIGFDSFSFTPGTAADIPTLGEWGLMILGLTLVLLGLVSVRQSSLIGPSQIMS